MVLTYNTAGPLLALKNKINNYLNEDGWLYTLINCETCSSFHIAWITALIYPYLPQPLIIAIYTYTIVTLINFIKFNYL